MPVAKRLSVVCVFCLAVLVHGRDPQKLTPQQIYEKYAGSVVHIDAALSDGKAITGTGFFFLEPNLVATCYHMINGAVKIQLTGSNGQKWSPFSVAYDKSADLALIRVTGRKSAPPLSACPFEKVKVGEPLTVIGNPLGFLDNTVSTGIVGAKRVLDKIPIVQFSAPVSHGSSGSPVFNARGEVVAVVQSGLEAGQALNFGASVDTLHSIVGYKWTTTKAYYTMSGASPAYGNAATSGDVHQQFVQEFARWFAGVATAKLRWDIVFASGLRPGGIGDPKLLAEPAKNMSEALREDLPEERLTSDPSIAKGFAQIQAQFPALDNTIGEMLKAEAAVFKDWNDPEARNNRQSEMELFWGAANKLQHILNAINGAFRSEPWYKEEIFRKDMANPVAATAYYCGYTIAAFPDPDLPDGAYIAVPISDASELKPGDQITGIQLVSGGEWAPVKTWDDYFNFVVKHVTEKRYCVEVLRVGKSVQVYTQTTATVEGNSDGADTPGGAPIDSKAAHETFLAAFAKWYGGVAVAHERFSIAFFSLFRPTGLGTEKVLDRPAKDLSDAFEAASNILPAARNAQDIDVEQFLKDVAAAVDAVGPFHTAAGLYYLDYSAGDQAHHEADLERWREAGKKLDHLSDALLTRFQNAPWFGWPQFENALADPIQRMLIFAGAELDAFPDPDIRDSAYIALPLDSKSHFKAADQIVGVALNESEPFTPVKTWDDYTSFCVEHKDKIKAKSNQVFVDVLRSGKHVWFWSNHVEE